MTLVEVLLQLRQHNSDAFRILVAAPSNTAADRFVELLSSCCPDIPPSEMIRLMAYSRDESNVSPQVRCGLHRALKCRKHMH